MKWILYIATILSFIAYNCWKVVLDSTGLQIFDKLLAMCLALICIYNYIKERNSFIVFLLFELTIFNVIKEFFLDPGVLTLEQAMMVVVLPTIWYFKEGNKTW